MNTTQAPTPYVRVKYTFSQSVFERFWYIFIIILFVVALLIMLILYCAIRSHFRESTQRTRCREIEENGGSLKRGLDLGYDKYKRTNSLTKKKSKRRATFTSGSREEQGARQGRQGRQGGVISDGISGDNLDEDEEEMVQSEEDNVEVMYDRTRAGGYQKPYGNFQKGYGNAAFQDPYAQPVPQQQYVPNPYAQTVPQQQYAPNPYAQPTQQSQQSLYQQELGVEQGYAYGYGQQPQPPQPMDGSYCDQTQPQPENARGVNRRVSFKLQRNDVEY